MTSTCSGRKEGPPISGENRKNKRASGTSSSSQSSIIAALLLPCGSDAHRRQHCVRRLAVICVEAENFAAKDVAVVAAERQATNKSGRIITTTRLNPLPHYLMLLHGDLISIYVNKYRWINGCPLSQTAAIVVVRLLKPITTIQQIGIGIAHAYSSLLLKATQNFKISDATPGFDIFNFLLPRDQIISM